MRVLLGTPPQPMRSILPNRYQTFSGLLKLLGNNKPILGLQPPYGLIYLSSYLKRAGHRVSVVDGLRSSTTEFMTKIAREKPDLVGISCVTWNWNDARRLARLIRTRFPQVLLAVGGAHVNAERGCVLDHCPDFDYAFYGDAEESFCHLVSALSANETPAPMDGFAFRSGGEVVASDRDAIIMDLDKMLLPDREQLGFRGYRPSPQSYRRLPFAAVFGSRGCPGRCTFCHTDGRIRIRSASSIVEEIVLLQRTYGIREVLFYDDNFTLRKKRVLELCDLLARKNIDLSWAASARVDTIDLEMLRAMKRAGCWRILLGIESGSQRILDRVRKGVMIEQVRRALEMTQATGIQTYGMFIFGFPTETYAEGLETIAFMKSLELDFVNVSSLTPFPGTEIYREVASERGFRGFDKMNMYDISYLPATMEEWELEDLLRRSMREFYLRGPYILRQVRNIRGMGDLLRYIRGVAVILLR